MIDEELLRPSRELVANIGLKIAESQVQAVQDIERYGYGDREYAKQRWAEHYMAVEPLRREQQAVLKVITDYYARQPMPPVLMSPTPPVERGTNQ